MRAHRAWRLRAPALALLVFCGAAAESRPTVPELVEIADITALSVSPDASMVAFRVDRASIGRNGYSLDWFVADLGKGEVRRIGDGGAAIEGTAEPLAADAPAWSPDSRFLFHRARIDGAIGLWRSAADGSGSRPVVLGEADVESATASPDGRTLEYVLGPPRAEIERAERDEYDEGIRIDGSTDLLQNLYRGGWVNGRLASQRLTGHWTSRRGLLGQAPRRRYRLDLDTLEARGPEPAEAAQPVARFAPSGVVFTLETAGRPVARIRRDGARFTIEVDGVQGPLACPDAACHTARTPVLAWRPGTGELAFTVTDSHYRQALYLWDTARGTVRAVMRGEGLASGSRDPWRPCAFTAAAAVCVTASAAEPPRLERIDLVSGARTVLYDPNGALRASAHPRVEQLSWTLADGASASGTILWPREHATPLPLFVSYYECPGYLRGTAGDEYPVGPLVDAGFVVACLNQARHGTSDIVADYRAGQESVEGLVRLLAARGAVDPGRVGMGGFSFGSEVTMWTAANSDILAAVAVASPQYTPARYWTSALPGRDYAQVLAQSTGLGAPEETPERWRLVSPALNTARIVAPVLMQLPENEARAQVEVFARLARTATPVEFYAFPDETHAKFQPRHRQAVYRRNLDWFRYWLQDYVDPDPAKAGQYRRWAAMRLRRDAAQSSNPRSQASAEAMSSKRM